MTSRELHWNISGEHLTVRVEESKGEGTFHIGDRSIPFHIVDHNTLEIGGRRVRFHIVRDGDSYTVWIGGRTYHLKRISRSHLADAAVASATGEITALMPGKVLRLEVAVGDTVSEKQTVAIMESMKMESALQAPKAGRIAEIRCQPGQVVEMGEVIMVID
jgi:acetyl/propionyl-CoA carboxylase alpha subunit